MNDNDHGSTWKTVDAVFALVGTLRAHVALQSRPDGRSREWRVVLREGPVSDESVTVLWRGNAGRNEVHSRGFFAGAAAVVEAMGANTDRRRLGREFPAKKADADT